MTELIRLEPAFRPERKIMYLHDLSFPLHIRNVGSKSLHLRCVWLRLSPSPEWKGDDKPLVCRRSLNVILVPGELHSVEITVTPPLFAISDSNSMTAGVDFDVIGASAVQQAVVKEQRSFDWIDVRDIPAHETAEVFISFVDPEDESLATLASLMLRRAGLRPYIAREESWPGCDYWAEKIYPAIARATGVFVIWTPDTARRPEAVVREMAHAQKVSTGVGLFLAKGLTPPLGYPAEQTEHVPFERNSPHEPFAQAIAAGRRRWTVTGKFF